MIDLSHLTEEEQGMILMVLKRDEELKKAEEGRIRVLQKKTSPAESKLKYLTGEWFYEAKSQRHTDTIHGSEIILASMKQRRALDRSLSLPRIASDKGLDIVAPPKPARLLETPAQPQDARESPSVPDADKLRLNVVMRSPARPRHNPFNTASIGPEESENTEKPLTNGNQESVKLSEAEPISPLKTTSCPASQTSTSSVTSEGSSVGFRPVPKKRTFLSRRPSAVSDSESSLSGRAPQAASMVPLPRGRHQHGSSGGSNHSSQGGRTTTPILESQNDPPIQPLNTPNQVSAKQMTVSLETRLEREEKPLPFTSQTMVEGSLDDSFKRSPVSVSPSRLTETETVSVALNDPEVRAPLDLKSSLFSESDRHNERLISGGQRSENRDGLTQREYDESNFPNRERSYSPFAEPLSPLLSKSTTPSNSTGQPSVQQHAAFKHTESPDEKKEVEEMKHTRNVGTAIRHEDLDQPVPYDLQLSDDKLSDKLSPKISGRKTSSKSSLRSPTPTGDEGNPITKVLEWFSRSVDSDDWLETESRQQGEAASIDQEEEEMALEDMIEPIRRDREDVYENRYQLREMRAPWVKRDHSQEDISSDEQDTGQGLCPWSVKTPEDRLMDKSPGVQSPVNAERTNQASKRSMSENDASDKKDSKEVTERKDEVKMVTGIQKAKANGGDQDDQPPKISHLKSFWERGNTGPKILISRSNTGVEKGPRPVHQEVEREQTMEKEKERERELTEENLKPRTADAHSIAALERVEGPREKLNENEQIKLDKKHKVVSGNDSALTRRGVGGPATGIQTSPGALRREDHKHHADSMTLAADPLVLDRRGSDAEILSLTGLSVQPEINLQSSLIPEPRGLSPSGPSPQPDTLLQSRASPPPVKLPTRITSPQHEPLSRSSPSPQPGTLHYARDSPDGDKLQQQSRSSPRMEYVIGGIDREQFTHKPETKSGTCGDFKGKEEEKRSVQSSVPPKKQDDPTFKDRGNSPHTLKQPPPQQESTAEKIRQLKSFWEQEKNRPMFYTGKSKELGDARQTRAPPKLSKRFTKSEYDLKSIGNESDSDNDSNLSSDRKNFTILAMNQRLSPVLGGNRSQFKNLRDFWGEAASNSFDKPKSPKRKESVDSQHPDFYQKSTPSPTEKVSARPPMDESRQSKSSLPPPLVRGNKEREHRPRSPYDRSIGAGSGAVIDSKAAPSHHIAVNSEQPKGPRPPQLRRSSVQNSTTDEKPPRPQGTAGKEVRPPKVRKDSFGNSSGRASAMRQATSMFALDVAGEQEQDATSPGQLRKTPEASPVQGRKTARQSADRGASPRRSSRSSEESESLAPRARAFVPRDYRHYLGITEKTSFNTSLAPAVKQKEAESKAGAELDLSEPLRTSTPTGSEERHGRSVSKTTQQPLRSDLASTETGREATLSSASETRPNSRSSSNRENNEDHPVRRALKRAETRPKNLAKSLEDITAFSPSCQERRQDPVAELWHGTDASSVASPSSSSFSDPEHLKKLSRSVPAFLQEERDGRDSDSASEDSYHGGRQMTDRSMTNLSTSSGMASVSSLSDSVTTMYSGDFGNITVQGNIQFSINYVQKLREFHIFVAQCRDLAAVDPKRGRSDPYVKAYLVPDKAKLGKRKTSVKKKTQNPTFNEILRYRVRMEYLRTQILILSVWHHDTFGKNCFLGEVDMDLSKWDFDHTQMNYLALKARPNPSLQLTEDRGEMRLAIRFLPQIAHSLVKEGPNTGEVHIWVKECKNLPLIRGATIDPYVKCFVLPDTSRKSRQKTRILRRTTNPMFNHTMVYDGFQQHDLREACVELTVWDRDRLASNLLGGLRLGPGTGRSYGAIVDWMDSTSYEVALWERMMASPDEWVEDVLPLRMLTNAKTALK